ncbi:hypothetical protein L9F63_022457, partial [Diploptera punctata]
FSMEMHCVFFNEKFGSFTNVLRQQNEEVLVMAFFLQVPEDDCSCYQRGNRMLDPLVKVAASIKDKDTIALILRDDIVDIILDKMESTDYYTYSGSLTTPKYNEIVKWVIYHTPICISHQQ